MQEDRPLLGLGLIAAVFDLGTAIIHNGAQTIITSYNRSKQAKRQRLISKFLYSLVPINPIVSLVTMYEI